MIRLLHAGIAAGIASIPMWWPPQPQSVASTALGPVQPLQCIVWSTETLQDQDRTLPGPGVWRRPPSGSGLTLYVSTRQLTAEYADYINAAASYWNRSACVDVEVVDTCPAGTNCVQAVTKVIGSGEVDGVFVGHRREGYLVGGELYLYTDVLAHEGYNARLATAVHELGHALGLGHRRDGNDVMAAVTGPYDSPLPDIQDYRNLAVVYGTVLAE